MNHLFFIHNTIFSSAQFANDVYTRCSFLNPKNQQSACLYTVIQKTRPIPFYRELLRRARLPRQVVRPPVRNVEIHRLEYFENNVTVD